MSCRRRGGRGARALIGLPEGYSTSSPALNARRNASNRPSAIASRMAAVRAWHNVAFYQALTAAMREAIAEGRFESFRRSFKAGLEDDAAG